MKTELKATFEKFYDHCLYSSIAHAVFVSKHPMSAYSQAWDGHNYSFIYGSATRGAITFDLTDNILAGAIRNDKTDRRSWYPEYRAIELFDEAPEAAKALASSGALQYLFDDIEGVVAPAATTAFWSEGSRIVSRDDLNDFIGYGGEFIDGIVLAPASVQELLEYWMEEDYDFTSGEIELVEHLFRLKKAGEMTIHKSDLAAIDEHVKGYKEFIACLAQIGFEVEQ